MVYRPLRQVSPWQSASLLVRTPPTQGDPLEWIRSSVNELEPRVAMARSTSLEEVLAEHWDQPLRLRFFLGWLSVLALLIGAVGVYGVISYTVGQRAPEYGLRMALGARRGQVLASVLRTTLGLVAVGVLLGLVASALFGEALRGFLYGVDTRDPMTYVVAILLMLSAGLGGGRSARPACLACGSGGNPARRLSTRLQPRARSAVRSRALPLKSPFFDRTEAHCRSRFYKDWAGHYAVCSYDTCHEPEYNALRHSVGAIDVSPLYKYDITGPDAVAFLNRLTVRDTSRLKPGRVTYLCWCDDDGMVIDDGTLTCLRPGHYRLTAAEPSLSWFSRVARAYDVNIKDTSDDYGVLSVQGPEARALLSQVCDADLSKLRFFRGTDCELGDKHGSGCRAPGTPATSGTRSSVSERTHTPSGTRCLQWARTTICFRWGSTRWM